MTPVSDLRVDDDSSCKDVEPIVTLRSALAAVAVNVAVAVPITVPLVVV